MKTSVNLRWPSRPLEEKDRSWEGQTHEHSYCFLYEVLFFSQHFIIDEKQQLKAEYSLVKPVALVFNGNES